MALATTGADASSRNTPFPLGATIRRGPGNGSQSSKASFNDDRFYYHNSSTTGHKFAVAQGWADLRSPLREALTEGAPKLLLALITAAQEAQELVVKPLSQIIRQMPHISLLTFAELVRVISLTVRSPEIALDLLLGSLEPESARLLEGLPGVVQHFVKSLIGLALDHIDEAKETRSSEGGLLDLTLDKKGRTSPPGFESMPNFPAHSSFQIMSD